LQLRLASLVAATLLLGGCGGRDDGGKTAVETSASGCRVVERPPPREPAAPSGKPVELNPNLMHRALVETNCGSFTITLDPKTSPKATASFATLANAGYFDNTIFHRIVRGFVIQGGDPTATGTGGPGYTTVDPPKAGTRYTKGVVAMAKSAAEPRGAAGSQFFVVTGDDIGLAPDYAVIGRVTDGLDVVERIGRLGDAREQPTETVVVERILIRRR
jgi:cyclophilin family peptidyl-prolyl cis-trans isomerase